MSTHCQPESRSSSLPQVKQLLSDRVNKSKFWIILAIICVYSLRCLIVVVMRSRVQSIRIQSSGELNYSFIDKSWKRTTGSHSKPLWVESWFLEWFPSDTYVLKNHLGSGRGAKVAQESCDGLGVDFDGLLTVCSDNCQLICSALLCSGRLRPV